MARLGKVPEFRDGMRVTDAETLEIARMVLVGKVNREIVSAINVHGSLAVGLSGEDANLITATARDADARLRGRRARSSTPRSSSASSPRGSSRWWPPSPATPRARPTTSTPTPWPGRSPPRSHAEKLVFLTDVDGPAGRSRRPRLAAAHASRSTSSTPWWRSGAASSGMIPKVEACARAVRGGVPRAHILDGRVPHALLLEVFTDRGGGHDDLAAATARRCIA